jgi:hypothetical protein
MTLAPLIPAKAGIHAQTQLPPLLRDLTDSAWVPAFAGTSGT